MSDLDQRYRRAIRWYPRSWRAANEDALVGALLDRAEDEGRTVPAAGELSNLWRSAIQTRLGIFGRLIPSAARANAAIITLGIGISISTAGVYFGGIGWATLDGSYYQYFSFGILLHSLLSGQFIYVIWLAVLVVALLGLKRTARTLLAASILLSVVWSVIAQAIGLYGHPSSISIGFVDLLALIALPGLVSTSARRRRSLAISAAIFTLLLWSVYLLRSYGGGYWGNGATNIDYFWAPLAVWLIFVGIPLALLLAIVFARLRRPAVAGGILFAGVPLIYLSLFAVGNRSNAMEVAGIVIAVLVAIALAIGLLRLLGLRIHITRV
ncbi:MAG TPA: hypothetical protein VHU90_08525 [Galbitalea sp.]|nr:hypothetical protein [Galbitalea sp.]